MESLGLQGNSLISVCVLVFWGKVKSEEDKGNWLHSQVLKSLSHKHWQHVEQVFRSGSFQMLLTSFVRIV